MLPPRKTAKRKFTFSREWRSSFPFADSSQTIHHSIPRKERLVIRKFWRSVANVRYLLLAASRVLAVTYPHLDHTSAQRHRCLSHYKKKGKHPIPINVFSFFRLSFVPVCSSMKFLWKRSEWVSAERENFQSRKQAQLIWQRIEEIRT